MVMHLGDRAYDLLILLNKLVNYTRSLFNLPNWSLAKFLKKKAKKAANYIGNFEDQMIEYCRKQGYDGIICGHIHSATIRELNGITYMNDGDWCESCTALVEHYDGKWEIINYV
jgi:UDP-2,3-diacylglucosamine pyrophosphatase LpxH